MTPSLLGLSSGIRTGVGIGCSADPRPVYALTSIAPSHEAENTPSDWWEVCCRRKWTFCAAFAVASGTGAWAAATLRPLYRARARLVVARPPAPVPSGMDGKRRTAGLPYPVENPATQAQLLASEDLHRQAREGTLPPAEAERHRAVRVEHAPGTDVIDLVVEGADPARTAALATRVVTLHVAALEQAHSRVVRRQLEFLTEERQSAQAELDRIEKRLLRLEESGALNPSGSAKAIVKLRASIAALWEQRQSAAREVTRLRMELGRRANPPPAQEAPGLHGTNETQQLSREQVAGRLKTLETELEATEAETRQARAELEKALNTEESAGRRRIEANHLQQRRETSLATVRALTERLVEARAGMKGGVPFASIQAASVPTRPFWPDPHTPGLVVLAGALFCGMAAMVLHERLGSFVTTAADAERAGLSLLGFLPPAQPISEAADIAARQPGLEGVVSGLEFAGVPQRGRVLLVIEPDGGREKSAGMLFARALVEAGLRVVLVDADLRSGDLPPGLPNTGASHRGLSQVLAGLHGEEEVLRATGLSDLWFLPAGPIPPNPADLLEASALNGLLARLGEQFDVVLLQGHPCLERPDALRLAARVEGVLFAAASGRLRVQRLRAWGAAIRRVGGVPLGIYLWDAAASHSEPRITAPGASRYPWKGSGTQVQEVAPR